jgi:hypothetical protein
MTIGLQSEENSSESFKTRRHGKEHRHPKQGGHITGGIWTINIQLNSGGCFFFCPNDFEGNEAGKYYCCDKVSCRYMNLRTFQVDLFGPINES